MTRMDLLRRGTFFACLLLLLLAGQVLAAAPGEGTGKAASIAWKDWEPGAFRRAVMEDRLVLLVLDVPWSAACRAADEQMWSDPAVAEAISGGYVPVRVRADLHPDLLRRYPAEGWPAITLLLPDGSPLFYAPLEGGEPRRMTATLMPPDKLADLLTAAAGWYRDNREEAIRLARERVAEIAKTARPEQGPVDQALAWSIAQNLRATFDAERRYFGGPPRIPRFDLLEYMLTLGGEREDPWRVIGTAGLSTLVAKLTDPEDGALWRMALGLDWERPQEEKLLDRNARYLDLLLLAWRETGRRNWADRARKVAAFLVEKLGHEDGSFGEAIAAACPGGRDDTVITASNALAASALMRAGAVLGDAKLRDRGLAAARFLRERRWRKGRGVARAVIGDRGILPQYLEDLSTTALAFLDAYQLTGDRAWLEAAEDVARVALGNLLDRSTGALSDTIPVPSGPALQRVRIYPLRDNARMVRVLVRLFYLTDSRSWNRAAEGILRAFGNSWDRVPLLIPSWGLAVYEYHFPPVIAVLTTPRADAPGAGAMREAALASPFPFTLVRTLLNERDRKVMLDSDLTIAPSPGMYVYYAGLRSLRIPDAGGVRGAIADLVEKKRAQDEAKKPRPPERPSNVPRAGKKLP